MKQSIIEQCFSLDNLLAAWVCLKKNPGVKMRGTINISMIHLKQVWFLKTRKELLNNKFKYPLRRRICVFQSMHKKIRFFFISSPRVKIVEKVILNVLEPLFEGT